MTGRHNAQCASPRTPTEFSNEVLMQRTCLDGCDHAWAELAWFRKVHTESTVCRQQIVGDMHHLRMQPDGHDDSMLGDESVVSLAK